MVESLPEVQVKEAVALPVVDGIEFGPLHSVCADSSGALYLSDEINHRVCSIDSAGKLQWVIGGLDGKAQLLRYPKGIDSGWIKQAGVCLPCLAICDSWNRRIRIVDTKGTLIGTWDQIGGREPAEPCDVRFIEQAEPGMGAPEAVWLVLDRGRHQLSALDPGGAVLFHIGRPLGQKNFPAYRERVMMDTCRAILNGKRDSFPRLDATFLPTRIMGQKASGIYVYEALGNLLKVVRLGCLVPMILKAPGQAEWFEVGDGRVLAWEAGRGFMHRYSFSTAQWQEIPISGRPIPFHGKTDRFWLQSQERLELIAWPFVEDSNTAVDAESPLSIPRKDFEAGVVAWKRSNEYSEFRRIVTDLVDTLNQHPIGRPRSWIDPGISADSLGPQVQGMNRALRGFQESVSNRKSILSSLPFQTLLYLYLANDSDADTDPALKPTPPGCPVSDMDGLFWALQGILDDVEISTLLVMSKIESEPGLRTLLSEMYEVRNNLTSISGSLFLVAMISALLEASRAEGSAPPPSSWLRTPAFIRRVETGSCKSRFLQEVDRIQILHPETNVSTEPYGLAQTSDGHLFVTFDSGAYIYHLGPTGKRIETIEVPAFPEAGNGIFLRGIAVDPRDRIWVVLPPGILCIYRYQKDGTVASEKPQAVRCPFLWPSAICAAGNAGMFVADMGHCRVVKVTESGITGILYDRAGKQSGELGHPVGLCVDAANPEEGIWVVDYRNHRLQKVSFDGHVIAEAAGPGFSPGTLIHPYCIAAFPDGTLAVSQRFWMRNIVLFSPDGAEMDRVNVDYSPSGLLVRDDSLIVAALDQSHLRVYRRRMN
jgi:hypothetical protein